MAYNIRQVSIDKESVRQVIIDLQKTILPADKVYMPDHGWWWILYWNNTPVGFCGMVKTTRWNDCLYFCRSGIRWNHRGKGLQKKLISVRLRKARLLGYNWVITTTYHNPASANSLIAHQFRLYTPTERTGARGTLYWRKKLKGE